jgi:hypothetical protein
MFDPEKFGEAMGQAIREAVGPLKKQIDELQSQLRAAPNFEEMVQEEVRKRLADIPEPKNGKDADMEVVRQMVSEAVAALPAPKEGKAGDPGKSITVEDVAPLIRDEIGKAVAALPAPKDGLGLAGAMIDRTGALQITLTNGEVKSLGVVVGKDGDNGCDGVSLDAFEIEYLPESHEIAIKAAVGSRVKELRYPAGGIRPAGYWREGTKAQAGEAWVHDGSTWFAKTATASKPESRSEDWIIAARKGRDGETVVKTINAGPPAPIKLQG